MKNRRHLKIGFLLNCYYIVNVCEDSQSSSGILVNLVNLQNQQTTKLYGCFRFLIDNNLWIYCNLFFSSCPSVVSNHLSELQGQTRAAVVWGALGTISPLCMMCSWHVLECIHNESITAAAKWTRPGQ